MSSFSGPTRPFGTFGQPLPKGLGGKTASPRGMIFANVERSGGGAGLSSTLSKPSTATGDMALPPTYVPDKGQGKASTETDMSASEQGDGEKESHHSSQVAVTPQEHTRAVSLYSTVSGSDREAQTDGLDLEMLAEFMRQAVLEVVDRRVLAIVDGALEPLQTRLSDLHAAVREHGDRVSAFASLGSQGDEEVLKLSHDIRSLSRQTEGVGPSVVRMQEDLQSILAKVRTLEKLHAETSSSLRSVAQDRSTRTVEIPSSTRKSSVRHRSRSSPRPSGAGSPGSRERHSRGERSSKGKEDAARQERRRRRDRESETAGHAKGSKGLSREKKGKSKWWSTVVSK